jgi:hypothetical protein
MASILARGVAPQQLGQSRSRKGQKPPHRALEEAAQDRQGLQPRMDLPQRPSRHLGEIGIAVEPRAALG